MTNRTEDTRRIGDRMTSAARHHDMEKAVSQFILKTSMPKARLCECGVVDRAQRHELEHKFQC
jgi:hypothetical protein